MVGAVSYIISMFLKWLGLFIAPIKDFNMLWILIPVWISWVFTEFYQEKKGTSFGNAISNGVIPLWVGIDWGKTTFQLLKAGTITMDLSFAIKIGIILFMMIYGIIIIIAGMRLSKITKYIGRMREVTYFTIVLTPIIYGVVPIETDTILAIILFFPIFYGIVELIDRIVPTPKTYDEDEGPSAGGEIPGMETNTELPGMEAGEIPGMETPNTGTQNYPQQQYPQQQYPEYQQPQQQYPQQQYPQQQYPQQQYPEQYPQKRRYQ